MKALILAAGYGTRLYPLTKNTAKPLLTFNGKTMLNWLLEKIQDFQELNEVLVVSNDKFYQDFQAWARENKQFPVPISVVNDGTKSNEDRLGSIGDISFVLKKNKISEDLLVLGGDNLFDYALTDYIAFARKKSPKVSIGLYDIRDINEAKIFGVVQTDQDKKIISFEEKPAQPKSSLIAMCLYYLPKESLVLIEEYIRQSQKADAAGGYIGWLSQRETVFGYDFQGKWYDIGSLEAYYSAQKDFQMRPQLSE